MLRSLMSLKPVITICGTTGVGKSKLAVELALALRNPGLSYGGYHGARIINADAMQVYAGLDVLTNKVAVEEQCGVEHLLMGFKQPGEQYVVGQWVKDAMDLIDEAHQGNQIPIVVGGTSYWIQHLIFPERLLSQPDKSMPGNSRPGTPVYSVPMEERSELLLQALASLPPELLDLFNNLPQHSPSAAAQPELAFSLHKLLGALDPAVGQRWHWKDTRKVLRSLFIVKERGRLTSEIINKQSHTVVRPRYRTLCFWLYAQPEVLNTRLDERVEQMLKGLLDEVAQLKDAASASQGSICSLSGQEEDYTLGIYQSIGYREFSSYLAQKSSLDASQDSKALHEAIDRMKLSTRKYAKRQVSWLRNKLLPAAYAANAAEESGGAIVPTYLLDATELGDKWELNVHRLADNIVKDFLDRRTLPDPSSLSDAARQMLTIGNKPTDPNAVLQARRRAVCPTCTTRVDQPVMIEEGTEWTAHVRTRRHRRLATQTSRVAWRKNHNNTEPGATSETSSEGGAISEHDSGLALSPLGL